jgi:hypothetical protein
MNAGSHLDCKSVVPNTLGQKWMKRKGARRRARCGEAGIRVEKGGFLSSAQLTLISRVVELPFPGCGDADIMY